MSLDLDRVAGALLGLAVGDALGAGYEFTHPAADAEIGMVGGGLGWAPGEWTDDTQMAVCIARVTAAGSLDIERIGDAFLDWHRAGPTDVGTQTRAVLSRARSAAELAAVAAEHFRRNPKGAAGNGSLMRTAPVALAHLGDDHALRDAAMAVSALTHGDPVAGEACVLWCVAIDRAVRERRLDGVRDGLALLAPERATFWRERLDEAEAQPPTAFGRNGYVVAALQAAWSAIWHTRTPGDASHIERALVQCVRIGGDTDTVAAIAGQVLGARYGASAVPWRWRRILHGWPGLRSPDLVRLAVLTARHGDVGSDEWPNAATLVTTARRTEGDGFCNPLADDPDLLVGNLPGLPLALDLGVHAVVSLCRVGRDDVPADVDHVQVWVVDKEEADANPNLAFVLDDAVDAVRTLRSDGKRVYLHCHGGRRRTAAVAAMYLSDRLGLTGVEAFERLGSALPEASLNAAFRPHVERTRARRGHGGAPVEHRIEAPVVKEEYADPGPGFEAPFWLKEIVSWRIAAELCRRHPTLLWPQWRQFQGGFYDLLTIERLDRASGAGRIEINRNGTGVFIDGFGERHDGGDQPESSDMRITGFLADDPRAFIRELERRSGLAPPPSPLPPSTPQSIAARFIAAFLGAQLQSRSRWTAVTAHGLSAVTGEESTVDAALAVIPGAHTWWRTQPSRPDAASRLWFLVRDGDATHPTLAVTSAGELHDVTGRTRNLLAVYRAERRSLARTLAAVAAEHLP